MPDPWTKSITIYDIYNDILTDIYNDILNDIYNDIRWREDIYNDIRYTIYWMIYITIYDIYNANLYLKEILKTLKICFLIPETKKLYRSISEQTLKLRLI